MTFINIGCRAECMSMNFIEQSALWVLVISVSPQKIQRRKIVFFSSFWVLWCECPGLSACTQVCLCVCVCVFCFSARRCLRLSVPHFTAGTAASSPASTWQWSAGSRLCRTTNACNPKRRSTKRKTKPGPLWSNCIRYRELNACTVHVLVHSIAPSTCRRAEFTCSYMLRILWIGRNKWRKTQMLTGYEQK